MVGAVHYAVMRDQLPISIEKLRQITVAAADPEILSQLSESQAVLLEYALSKAKELLSDCLFYRTFTDDGKHARRYYKKHIAFIAAGKHAKERAFISANRTGKTYTAGYESTAHLIGEYPHWWEGRVFDEPVHWTVSGLTNETTRDIMTPLLLGKLKQNAKGRNWPDGTGMIPWSRIIPGSLVMRGGAGRLVAEIQVQYRDSKSEYSTLYMKSNEQGFGSFSGTARHGGVLDEEHDLEVYSEMLTRTATTNGLVMTLFTPLNGITPTVLNFLPKYRELAEAQDQVWDPNTGVFGVNNDEYTSIQTEPVTRDNDGMGTWVTDSMYTMKVGWADNPPHLTEKEKRDQIRGTPPYLLDAKTKGDPVLGLGKVYPINLDRLYCPFFQVPDDWPRAYGMDVGWNFTAIVWGAYNEYEDCWYLYREYRHGQAPPIVHAHQILARDDWIPGVIDPSSVARNARDGQRLIDTYRDLGLNLTEADNAVTAGIEACYNRMTTNRLKIFPHLPIFESEFNMYRYKMVRAGSDDPGYGRPVKQNDHLMDAMRYLILSGPMVMKTRAAAAAESFKQRGGWVGETASVWAGDSIAGY